MVAKSLTLRDEPKSNQKRGRVKAIPLSRRDGPRLPRPACGERGTLQDLNSRIVPLTRRYAPTSPRKRGEVIERTLQFVLATRGGDAVVMNCVASNIAVPSGVGITIRNGTRMRVPATGANAISMLRCADRYLITGRSGM